MSYGARWPWPAGYFAADRCRVVNRRERRVYTRSVSPPEAAETWVGLSDAPLPLDQVYAWVGRPDCGGIVMFSGTARDHSEGRPGVTVLEYEAYGEQVAPRLEALVDEARVRWPEIGRVALLHRVGRVEIGDSAVVAAVSAPIAKRRLPLPDSVSTV